MFQKSDSKLKWTKLGGKTKEQRMKVKTIQKGSRDPEERSTGGWGAAEEKEGGGEVGGGKGRQSERRGVVEREGEGGERERGARRGVTSFHKFSEVCCSNSGFVCLVVVEGRGFVRVVILREAGDVEVWFTWRFPLLCACVVVCTFPDGKGEGMFFLEKGLRVVGFFCERDGMGVDEEWEGGTGRRGRSEGASWSRLGSWGLGWKFFFCGGRRFETFLERSADEGGLGFKFSTSVFREKYLFTDVWN